MGAFARLIEMALAIEIELVICPNFEINGVNKQLQLPVEKVVEDSFQNTNLESVQHLYFDHFCQVAYQAFDF